MNATVTRIVELLFQDVAPSAEVDALREEVLNNCQERYADLVSRGLTEDEAITAVVESLKGMEEVISAYPKARPAAEKALVAEPAADGLGLITRVEANLTSADLDVLPSEDGQFHIDKNHDALEVTQVGETLRIHQRGSGINKTWENKDGSRSFSFTLKADSWFQLVSIMRNEIQEMTGSQQARITLRVPAHQLQRLEAHTTVGDILWRDVSARQVRIETTSGDAQLELPDGEGLQRLDFASTSGDLQLNGDADLLRVNTISGDLRLRGTYARVEASATSGDVNLLGMIASGAKMRSVSGDLNLELLACAKLDLEATSTSGDVSIALPPQVQSADLQVITRSGGRHIRHCTADAASPIHLRLKSVSGDIAVR